MKNIQYYLLSSMFLIACGGGDNESVTTVAPVPSVSAAPSPQLTLALQTTASFDFMSNYKLVLQINNLSDSTGRFYINVCSEYKEIQGRYQINYNSCVLRTSLNDSHREFELVLSDNEQQLIAQVWPIEYAAKPVNQFWEKTQENGKWVISLQ
jgi:hypothetical protein